MTTRHNDKVIRIQGDKLCGYLGLEPGTKIELKTIKQIATATFGDSITLDGKEVKLSMHMIEVAKILLEKIEG